MTTLWCFLDLHLAISKTAAWTSH